MSERRKICKFDFRIDEHHDEIVPEGYYSQAEARSATREEVLLWRRVQELEDALDRMRGPEVQKILDRLQESEEDEIEVTAMDFALLRAHARDVVTIEENLTLVRERKLGYLDQYEDGRVSRRYLRIAIQAGKS